jgi:uncharacterized protein (DUF1697 family)
MIRNRYVALLRGVNVGRAKRVAMADLRKLVGDLGFDDVRSVLNSGNVVFSAPPLAPADAAVAIEEALVLKLGIAARVMVLGCDELSTVISENTLLPLATDPARLITFIYSDPQMRHQLEPLCGQDRGRGALALGQRAAYVWCPDGVLDSPAAARVGKLLGDNTTARNWSTLSKLHVLCAA